MPKLIDLTEQIFGKLKVLQQAGKDKWGHYKWLCLCNCNRQVIVSSGNLESGHTKSCGCLQKEMASKINTKHGHGNDKIYKIWATIIQRCINPNNKQWKDYGGRGITVCERWMKFENFFEDMGEAPDGYQIDRIKNDKGYYKENCRWATPKEQSRNKRNNRPLMLDGKTQLLIEWSEETGILAGTILWRLNHGWPIEKALTTPARKCKKWRKNGRN